MIEILCSKSHEYVYSKDNFYYIGITDVMADKLTNVQKINLPSKGEFYTKGEIFGYIEAKKIAIELFMPITGYIEEINDEILSVPEKIYQQIGQNWLLKLSSDFFEENKIDLIDYNNYKKEN